MDTEALRAEARATFGRLLAPRRADRPATVLGAGADDLAPGRAYLEALAPGGWAVPTWPRPLGGRGATPEEAGVIGEELARFDVPGSLPVPGRAPRGRPHGAHGGQPGAARPVAARHRDRRRDLVPALLRARRRIGLGERRRTRRTGRGHVAGQRPEGLDQPGRVRASRLPPGPHRPGRPQAHRDHRVLPRHARAGRRRAPAAPDERRRALQRGVPRRRARRRPGPHRRAGPRRGRSPAPGWPTSGARSAR